MDDLKILYSRIKVRHIYNVIWSFTTNEGVFYAAHDITQDFFNHFYNLFNSSLLFSKYSPNFPTSSYSPPHVLPAMVAPVSNEKVKKVVFPSPNSSTPSYDWFTFEFYNKSWLLIENHVCKIVKHFFHTSFLPENSSLLRLCLFPRSLMLAILKTIRSYLNVTLFINLL